MSHSNVPDSWRHSKQAYHLNGIACPACQKQAFGRLLACPHCGSDQNLRPIQFKPTGQLLGFTKITDAPADFEKNSPYIIGLIDLGQGARLTTQIVDCTPKDLQIGQDLEAVMRKVKVDGEDGIIEYGYKFRPLLS